MSRTNLVLLGLFAAVVAAWVLGRDWGEKKTTGPAPRLFPDFNREAADAIEISGGWQGTSFTLARRGTEWRLASAGDYDVKSEEVEKFLDAVWNLRQENELGAFQERTHTDEKNGRLVRVLRAGQPMAEFRIGKNPKQGYQEFFIRREGDDAVYRTRTILTKDRKEGIDVSDDPFASGPTGFDWHNYVNNLSTKWVAPDIWDLKDAEAQELWLSRKDALDVKLVRKGADQWELVEAGKEPVAADADAAEGIVDQIRRLSLYEVAGTWEGVREEYGLDAPETTLVMKLRKKVEKKAEAGAEGEEPKTDEYVTIDRIVEVGKKVTRPRYDSYDDELEKDEYYAVRIGPARGFDDAREERRTGYVFLVRSYHVGGLNKSLEDLRAKPEEKGDGEAGGGEPGGTDEDEGEPRDGCAEEGCGCGCGDGCDNGCDDGCDDGCGG